MIEDSVHDRSGKRSQPMDVVVLHLILSDHQSHTSRWVES